MDADGLVCVRHCPISTHLLWGPFLCHLHWPHLLLERLQDSVLPNLKDKRKVVSQRALEAKENLDYCTMMVKTHLSLSHDPNVKGVPTGWRLPIRDILEYGGAKFLCPMAGTISMMPGTGSNPAYRRVDVDTATGKVSGLF